MCTLALDVGAVLEGHVVSQHQSALRNVQSFLHHTGRDQTVQIAGNNRHSMSMTW